MKIDCLYKLLKGAQRGSIMIFFVMLLPVLFGFMGLAVDFGLAYVQKGKLQDVADATALAAAVHLADNDTYKMSNIKDKVVSTVTTNGLQLPESAFSQLADNASEAAWNDTSLPDNQDIKIIYGIVAVNNSSGDPVDRVRVRITKRSPVFFLGVLGDFSDGLIVSVKAAAEGAIEQVSVTDEFLADGPAFVSYGKADQQADLNIYSAKMFSNAGNNGRGFDKDVYVYGTLNNHDKDKFQIAGTVYAMDVKGNIQFKGGTKDFQHLDDGSTTSNDKTTQVYDTQNACQKIIDELVATSFSHPLAETKIFIDKDGINPPSKAVDSAKTYDVFVEAKDMIYDKNNEYVIINGLQNIKNIDNLYISYDNNPNIKGVILNTDGVQYNNVYIDGNGYIEGSNNKFNGRIYTNGALSVLGNNNGYVQLLGNGLNIGYGFAGRNVPDGYEDWKWNLNRPGAGGTPGKKPNKGHNKPGSGTIIDSSGNTSVVIVSKLRLVE